MVSWYRKPVKASSRSGKCYGVKGERYTMTSGVCLPLEMTLQLTTFKPWKRVKYTLQNWGRSLTTSPTTPCALPAVVDMTWCV